MKRTLALAVLLGGCNTPQITQRDNDEVVTWPNGAVAVLARNTQQTVTPPQCYVRARFSGVFVPLDCDTARLINVR